MLQALGQTIKKSWYNTQGRAECQTPQVRAPVDLGDRLCAILAPSRILSGRAASSCGLPISSASSNCASALCLARTAPNESPGDADGDAEARYSSGAARAEGGEDEAQGGGVQGRPSVANGQDW
jgi:hypothetical protein